MSTSTLLVLALALGANEPEVLWFTSANCPHCKTAGPTMDRLGEMGLAVKKIDVDARPEVAQQFNITALPTTILLRGGREADRIVGPASFDRLVQMLDGGAGPAAAKGEPANQPPQPAGSEEAAQRRAFAAAVRLRVEDRSGAGVGTGTIIDQYGPEVLILTCGHIFREGQGKGKIMVEFFAPGNHQPVVGQFLEYNLEHDVALVACRPGFAVEPAPVAGPEHRTKVGDPVFTIGCNKGADATVQVSRIMTVDKYLGHPNVTVKGAPVVGRSGGGLFTADGRLMGVCNAADASDDEGVYASLPAVHAQLDKINQARIYKKSAESNLVATPKDDSRIAALGNPPRMSDRMPVVPNNAVAPATFTNEAPPIPESARIQPLSAALPLTQPSTAQPQMFPPQPAAPPAAAPVDDDLEVFVMVRPKNNPQAQPQVYLLNQLPPELRQRLQDPRVATRPNPNDMIIRGQNGRY